MVQEKTVPRRRTFALSTYIPILLVCAAIFPLLTTIISSEILSRPALIDQSRSALKTDAQSRVQLINAYLVERLKDIQVVSQFTPLKAYLSGGDVNSQREVSAELVNAQHRDAANYDSWSVFDTQGKLRLSYPTAPQPHGQYLVLPEIFKQLQKVGKVLISDVFYDYTAQKATVDLYARVIDNNFKVLGLIRATLDIHHVWDIVDNETRATGAGSYAMIVDQNGVCIAYTSPDPSRSTLPRKLFKAIKPLPDDLAQRIQSENLYGDKKVPVTVSADAQLATALNDKHPSGTFEITPVDLTQNFLAARYTSLVVPWSYFIFKPLGAVTSIADQQLLSTILIATVVLILAIILGLIVGRSVTRPVLRAVTSLRKSSQLLKTFSSQEHMIVNEQTWMVEASKIGLESVQYYNNAINFAAQKLINISYELQQITRLPDGSKASRSIKEVEAAARYIEKAIGYQDEMNEKLETTIRVTTQITEQLLKSARSADDAANQLEEVVNQLRSLTGEQRPTVSNNGVTQTSLNVQ